jgi:hypothetical protein
MSNWYDAALTNYYRSKELSAEAISEGVSSASKSLSGAIKQAQEDYTANQLAGQMLNSGANAPRAALVAPGNNPQTGAPNQAPPPSVPTQGTAPQVATGGTAGLQMRLAIQKANQESQTNQSEMALRRAQAQNLQGEQPLRAAQTRYWNQRADVDQSDLARQKAEALALKNADTMPKLQQSIDAAYGKGTTSTFFNSIVSGGMDPNTLRGRIELQDGNHVWISDPKGPLITPNPPQANKGMPLTGWGAGPGSAEGLTTMPFNAFQGYLSRYSAIQQSPNGMVVPPGSNVPGQGGALTNAGGTNVPVVKNAQDYNSLPPGQYRDPATGQVGTQYRDPTGVVRIKPNAPTAVPGATPPMQ